jgi:hypothetical protein
MRDFIRRIKKNWLNLFFSIASLLLLACGSSLPYNIGLIGGIACGIISIFLNLYSSDMEWIEL